MSTAESALHGEVTRLLGQLGVDALDGDLIARTPIDGGVTGRVPQVTPAHANAAIGGAHHAFLRWRAVRATWERVARESEREPGPSGGALRHVWTGGGERAGALAAPPAVPLVSATGSTAMGRSLAPRLARRFARALLELGGNNGAIVCPSADQELALRAIAFAWMGTAGQRCTTLRRLFVHRDLADGFVQRLVRVSGSVAVGDPLDPGTLVGPLIDRLAFDSMQSALKEAASDGGLVEGGAREHAARWPNAW